MATKKTTSAQNSAGKQRQRPRGKPFEPGNAWAWKKGAPSPNPGGRPKSRHLSKAGAQYLALPSAECPDITNAEHIIAVVGARAKAGDEWAVKWLADRTEGKLQAKLDITHSDEQKRREWAEAQLARVMEALKIEREEAVRWMQENTPTAAQWIN